MARNSIRPVGVTVLVNALVCVATTLFFIIWLNNSSSPLMTSSARSWLSFIQTVEYIFLASQIVGIYGSVQILSLKKYSWAKVAIATTLLSTLGNLFALPIGIWALIAIPKNKSLFIDVQSQMSPELQQQRDSEKKFSITLRDAEKKYRATIRTLEKTVKQSEKALKAANEMGQKKLARFYSANLYENRIETLQGIAMFEAKDIYAEASPSGNVSIRTETFESLVIGKPDQFEKAKEFSEKIQTATKNAQKIKEEKLTAIAQATELLNKAQKNLEVGAAEAEAALAKVKAESSK